MRYTGQQELLDHVVSATIPMRGRMIHGRRPSGDLFQERQDYDVHGRVKLHSIYYAINMCEDRGIVDLQV